MNRNLVFITITLTIWGVGEGMFFSFQPIYLEQLGAGPVLIGFVLGGVGIAMTVAHLPAGYLADRFGRRPLLWLACFIATFATWIMAFGLTLPVFALGSMLYGLTAFVAGPLNGYITFTRGKWSISRALTLVLAFYNAGGILGPLLGGWIGETIGLRWAFIFAGILFTIATIFILQIEKQEVAVETQDIGTKRWSGILSRRFWLFLAVIFISMFSMFVSQPLSQNFLQSEHRMDLNQIGFLIAARGVGVVLFNLVLGQMNARYGFILTQLAMGAFSITIWRGGSLPVFVLGYMMLGSYQTARSLIVAQGTSLVKANEIGLAYGMFETIGGLVFITAAPLAGYLFSLKTNLPYQFSIVMVGISIMLTLIALPVNAQDVT